MLTVDQLLDLANEAQAHMRLDEARAYHAKVAILPLDREQTLKLIELLKGIGRIERDRGSLDLALAIYEKAATICLTAGDDLLLAHTLRHVGDILAQQGKIGAALEKCQNALRIYRENPKSKPLDLANAIRSCALIGQEFTDLEMTKRLWEEAKYLYASVEIWAGVEECDSHLGRVLPRAPG